MSDLPGRLRHIVRIIEHRAVDVPAVLNHVADEIERLQSECDEFKAAYIAATVQAMEAESQRQEAPVYVWYDPNTGETYTADFIDGCQIMIEVHSLIPLYAAPQHYHSEELRVMAPERKPLTDNEILSILSGMEVGSAVRIPPGWEKFARAIERAHGIGDGQ